MFKIAICETNQWEQALLKKMVEQYMEQMGFSYHIQCFGGGFELLDHMSAKGGFHIAIINASMERFNGVETAKELRQYDQACQLIFVSFTDEFAISAYSVNAQYYLLKPVTQEELSEALAGCMKFRREVDLATMVVKTAAGYYNILHRHILYMESGGHKISIYLANGECISVYGRLDDYEKIVQDDPRFVRIHKSTMVNADYIFFIGREEIILYDKTVLKISRNLAGTVKTKYFQYINKKHNQLVES